jgi:hypothetical protein
MMNVRPTKGRDANLPWPGHYASHKTGSRVLILTGYLEEPRPKVPQRGKAQEVEEQRFPERCPIPEDTRIQHPSAPMIIRRHRAMSFIG